MTVLDTATINLGGDTAGLEAAFSRAQRRMEQLGAKLDQAGRALTTRVTLPLIGLGIAATKATADWETAMVNIAKTVDAPAAQLEALGNTLVGMSERIPVAADELANIAAEAGQLGIAFQNLRGFTEVVAALRVSTNLGEKAGTTLARLANIMGTAQTDFDRMGSTIVALGNNLATTEAEIADMALRIAGAGKTVGLTEAQVLGLAGALSSVGIRSEQGGTAISRVMVDIASAVNAGGEALNRFASVAGMTAEQFRERFETDATAAIEAFVRGLGRIDEQGGNVFGALEALGLADVRVRDTLLRAAGASDLFASSIAIGTEAWQENTALANEADRFYNRLAATFTQLRNKLVNVTAEFGDALRPAIRRATDAANQALDVLRNLVQHFAMLSPEMRIQIAGWVGIAAAVGPALVALGSVAKVFAFLGGVVLIKVAAAVGAVTLAVLAIKNNWLGMGDAALAAWNAIVNTVVPVVQTLDNAFRPWINFVIASFRAMGAVAVIIFDEFIKEPFIAAMRAIKRWAEPVFSAIAAGFELIGRLGEGAAEKIRNFFDRAGDEAEASGNELGARIADAITTSFDTDYVGAFLSVVQRGIQRAQELIARAAEMLRGLLQPAAAGAAQELDLANQELTNLMETVETTVSNPRFDLSKLVEPLKEIIFAAEAAFVNMVGSIVEGTASMAQAFGNMVKQMLADLARLVARMLFFRALLSIFPGAGGVLGLTSSVPGFAAGGIVPGVAGQAQLAVVHGGEMVVPRDQAQSGNAFSEVARALLEAVPEPTVMSEEEYVATRRMRRRFSLLVGDGGDRGVRYPNG